MYAVTRLNLGLIEYRVSSDRRRILRHRVCAVNICWNSARPTLNLRLADSSRLVGMWEPRRMRSNARTPRRIRLLQIAR